MKYHFGFHFHQKTDEETEHGKFINCKLSVTDNAGCTYKASFQNSKFTRKNRVTDFPLVLRAVSELRENLSHANICLEAPSAQ